MKRVSAVILAALLSINLVIPVNAAEVTSTSSTGDTPVQLTAEATTFNVIVPTRIAFSIDSNAQVISPNNLAITNNSAGPVEVTGIEVQNGNWTLTNYNNGDRSLLASEKVGSNKLGIALIPDGGTQSATVAEGTQNLTIDKSEWKIESVSSLGFDVDAIATAVASEITSAVQAANIIFTIGWSSGTSGTSGGSGSSSDTPEGVASGNFISFSSPSTFSIGTYNSAQNWDGTLEYSTDATNDASWTTWDGTSEISAASNGATYTLYIRGTGNSVISPGRNGWTITGTDVRCDGNIENILDYGTVTAGNHPTMGNECFASLFVGYYGWECLIKAPELKATTLSPYCYSFMFQGCTGLTEAPDLPATTLTEGCYYWLFQGCSNLTKIPSLPATTMAFKCYAGLFAECTSLTEAPALPAATLAASCYNIMFYGCTSLTEIPVLPATTLPQSCYQAMFSNCTSLKISETPTEEYTQAYRIPESENGTAETFAVDGMFTSTGGPFVEYKPSINKTYYIHKDNTIVPAS